MDEKSRLEEKIQKLKSIKEKFEKQLNEYHSRFEQISENKELSDFERLCQLTSLYCKIEELTNFCVFLDKRCITNLLSQLESMNYQGLSEEEKTETEDRKLLTDDRRDNYGFRK